MSSIKEGSLYAIVMAGGRGTRFWPESTSARPKQYLGLTGNESLLSKTLSRFDGLVSKEQRYVVTVKEQEKLATECGSGKMAREGLIFEPSGRNTAPCILLSMAALEAQGAKEDDVLAIVPSDHVILNENAFRETVRKASEVALSSNSIVTIGIRPNFPHTGYGYIQRGEEEQGEVFKVKQFKEKPNKDVAKEYVSTGEYFWNAGMFVASLKTLKDEFKACSPETFEHFESLKSALVSGQGLAAAYDKLPQDSIDYAVMEKSRNVMVVGATFDWNDLGSWDALESVIEPKKGNTLVNERASFIKDSEGNIVFAPGKHVSLIGVNNLIVVSNDKTVVVLPKERSQEIKEVVASLSGQENLSDLI